MDISCSNIFPNILSWAREKKEKNKQMGLYQTKKLLHSKNTPQKTKKPKPKPKTKNYQQNENTTYWMGEHSNQ